MKWYYIFTLTLLIFTNLMTNISVVGHFSLLYCQIMIMFVIEEVHLRWNERFNYCNDYKSIEDQEMTKLYDTLADCPRLNYLLSDITEIGFILQPECIRLPPTSVPLVSAILIPKYQQIYNDDEHQYIGLYWLVARGYTRSRIAELEEDISRIKLYLRNIQNAKAIDSL